MAKEKISATVDPHHLAVAQELTGAPTISGLLDEALVALIEREQERRWLVAHDRDDGDSGSDQVGEVVPDLGAVPWDG